MSAFEDFDDTFAAATPTGGADVQDFLRREQEALGDAAPASAGLAMPAAATTPGGGFFDEDLDAPAPASATGDAFGTEAVGDNDDPFGAAAQPADGEQVFYVSQQQEYVDPYAALQQANETPQAIQDWRAKRDGMLDAKDKASRDKVKQMEAEAKAAMDKFAKEYQVKKEATKKKNRDAQAAIVASRDAPAKGNNNWERVYNLVDLTPKGQKSLKDVSRVRNILTQLKTDVRAPGAA